MSGYNPRNANASVSVIAIDPGSTTGIAIISIDARWVRGLGEPSYDGLGRSIRSKVAYQIGRDPKALYEGSGARKVTTEELDSRMLPIYANQPAHEDHGTRRDDRFREIMSGEQFFGGALQSGDAGEIVQVRQIAGLLENYSKAVIVIEDFTLRTPVRSREVTSPDRLRFAITMNEILHGSSGRVPFLQMPSYAKSTATDERLKRAGLWFAGMPHANDAARHALTFLRDARQHEELRAHAWPHKFADLFDED